MFRILMISMLAVLMTACLNNSDSASVGTGKQAPELEAATSFNTSDGGSFKLSDFKGKIVAVDFWATWCGPCISSMPHIIAWHEKYNERGLVIIGYTDESSKNLESFIEKHEVPYIIGVGDNVFDERYGIEGIPHLALIDQDGKIIKRGHPMSFEDADIESALSAAGL